MESKFLQPISPKSRKDVSEQDRNGIVRTDSKGNALNRMGVFPDEKNSYTQAEAKSSGRLFPAVKGHRSNADEDIDADEEFERLKIAPTVVEPKIARSRLAQEFVDGFKM